MEAVRRADRQVGGGLAAQTVKKSLQELSRSINGDAKTEVQPLFRIHVVLQNNKVEFKPSIAELTQTVNNVSKEAIATTGDAAADEALAEAAESGDKGAARGRRTGRRSTCTSPTTRTSSRCSCR